MTSVKVEDGQLLACRICLVTNTKLFGIYENSLDKIFEDTLGCTVSAWDGFPQHLCVFCRTLLLKSADLRKRSKRAEALLRQAVINTHYLTTDIIKAIDRITNNLSLHLSVTHIDRDPKPVTVDIKNDLETNNDLDVNNKLDVSDTFNEDKKPDIESDDSMLLSEYTSDVELSKVISIEIEVKNEPGRLKKQVKNKVKKGVKPLKEKKGHKRYFSTEEDYVKFENKYNIKVVKLSEDEQRREMECRKETDNYRHAHVRCEKCCKGFLSKVTFENHNKIHEPSTGSNVCPLCHSRYKLPTLLTRHMMETHAHKYICKGCDQVIKSRKAAMMHSEFHAGRTFECKYCGQTFNRASTCYSHMRLIHPEESSTVGACDVCGETFTGALGLQQHKTRRHNRPAAPELKCNTCKVQFENLDAVARHTDRTNNICNPELRACPQCGETFPTKDKLATHKLTHSKKTYKCDDCNQEFVTKSSLSTHIDRVHLKIKPYNNTNKYSAARKGIHRYICETCGKGYPRFCDLKSHKLRHTGERPFKCSLCPKDFHTAKQVNGHQRRVHAEVKKHQCPQCPKSFHTKSSINKHKLVHTGEKPFECQICNKSFNQSGSLSTHIKYVHMKITPPPRRRRDDD